MSWTTPTLRTLRQNARAYIMASLSGADALIPNSVLRVMADVNAGLSHLVLQFVEWIANQMLPITAVTEWLDRWATLYLINADGSRGRKQATFSAGSISINVIAAGGATIASGTIFAGPSVQYQTTADASSAGPGAAISPVIALTAGAIGNLDAGSALTSFTPIAGTAGATVISLTGGTDTETDDQLRARLLLRLANPPMGGDAIDYEQWTLSVPGVTRAWASPQEMGPGTMTVRFMCDDLRSSSGGFPLPEDVTAVFNYLETVRPVTVKDLFVVAPIPYPISFIISNLDSDDETTWNNIIASVQSMLFEKAKPGWVNEGIAQPAQTIYAAWVSGAILDAAGVNSFDLICSDFVMPNSGSMATLGSVIHG